MPVFFFFKYKFDVVLITDFGSVSKIKGKMLGFKKRFEFIRFRNIVIPFLREGVRGRTHT